MSIKLYAPAGNFRTNAILIAGELAGVPVELHHTDYSETKTAEHKLRNPFGKVPAVETENGPIFETSAILRHIARVSGKLYGSSVYESAMVDQYLDANNSELFPALLTLVLPYFGLHQVEKEVLKTARTESLAVLKILDERLKTNKFLAGSELTIVDIQLASNLILAFRVAFSEEQRKPLKNLVEYFLRVAAVPAFVKYWGHVHLSATEFEFPTEEKKENKKKDAAKAAAAASAPAAKKEEAPKKECTGKKECAEKKECPVKKEECAAKKECQKKKEEPKAVVAAKVETKPAEVEEVAEASSWNLYDFKTLYTNAKDKNDAIKNLVDNFNPAEWCIYHIHYQKYEGEGTVVYVFNNMKNGFLQRCEAARKKAFGTYSIYGDEPNLDISGVWLFQGTTIPVEMNENPAFEYHDLKKLDISKPEDLEVVRNYWTKIADDESVVNGLTLRAFGSFK